MSKVERFDYLEAEARKLRAAQRKLSPISREWMALEMQIAGCFMMQAEC
jgi:hypothetical protein